MGHRFDPDSDVEQLLAELCIGLGFCLPPDEIRQLCESPPRTVDSFTDAVFEAEGMGDMNYTDLRRQVREVVARHMSGWPGEGLAARSRMVSQIVDAGGWPRPVACHSSADGLASSTWCSGSC